MPPSTARVALALVFALAACAAPPAEVVYVPVAPLVGPPEAEPLRPVEPACNARLVTRARPMGSRFEVEAVVRNETGDVLSFTLPDRCPAGPADFDGLGSTYDYYGACASGACPGPRRPVTISLAPGEERVVASIAIDPAGDACQRPIAERAATIGFSLAGAEGLVPCASERAELVVAEARPAPQAPPSRPAPPPPSAPPTTPRRDCPAIACGGCPGGYEPSTDGCPSCTCRSFSAPGVAPTR